MKQSPDISTLNLPDLLLGTLKLLPRIPGIIQNIKKAKSIRPEEYLSIGRIIETNAIRHENRVALRYEEQSYTYREFNEHVNQYAHFLLLNGVKNGDTVIVFIENRPELLFLITACSKIGAVLSIINPNQRAKTLQHSIELDPSPHYFIGEELVECFEDIKPSLPANSGNRYYWVSDTSLKECPFDYKDLKESLLLLEKANPQSTNRIQAMQQYANVFTSGTTGLPKAARQTHRKWMATYYWFGKINMNLKPDDVMYVPLPFYHTNALIVAWPTVQAAGCTMVIRRKFSVSNFWQDVHEYDVSAFIYIGEICRYLLNAEGSNLERNHRIRKIMGNGMRPDIWKLFMERFGIPRILEFYGAADGNVGFTNTLNLDNTIGWSPQNFRIIQYDVENDMPVVDDQGHFRIVSKGGTGLLISEISDEAVFDGYVNKEQNATKIFRDAFKKGDAWFNSGDLLQDIGYRHARFVERIGDTFRWKGENVSTSEIESLANTLDYISLCAVYGVSIPNNDGTAGMICLVMNKDFVFDPDELSNYFNNALPKYAIPLFVRLSKGLITTHTHKIKKFHLKKEGYNVTDPVYVMMPDSDTYVKMDEVQLSDINKGKYIF